jgi:hypothetical protein
MLRLPRGRYQVSRGSRCAAQSAGLILGNPSAEKPGMMVDARCPMIALEAVSCEVCLKEIPKSEAAMAEAREYVAYFCGLECYRKWTDQRAAETAPQAAVPAST